MLSIPSATTTLTFRSCPPVIAHPPLLLSSNLPLEPYVWQKKLKMKKVPPFRKLMKQNTSLLNHTAMKKNHQEALLSSRTHTLLSFLYCLQLMEKCGLIILDKKPFWYDDSYYLTTNYCVNRSIKQHTGLIPWISKDWFAKERRCFIIKNENKLKIPAPLIIFYSFLTDCRMFCLIFTSDHRIMKNKSQLLRSFLYNYPETKSKPHSEFCQIEQTH